jgi:hypothetical protein
MSKFEAFVTENSAAQVRDSKIGGRFWKRRDSFTTGNTLTASKTTPPELEGKTLHIAKQDEGFTLYIAHTVDAPFSAAEVLCHLKETEIKNKEGLVSPVLKGIAMINGQSSEIVIRANSLQQKQDQVNRAIADGRLNAIVSNQPDLYMSIATYSTSKTKPVVPAMNSNEMPDEDLPF